MTINEHALLTAYSVKGSEQAFRDLVSRYIGLVYSTALRRVGGDTHRAEDVTQIVFVDLARHAGDLSAKVMIGGWLHQRTFNVATTMMRGEHRRKAREQEAAEMKVLEDHSAASLAQIGPVLDEAIMELKPEDRAVLLLRFFERRDLRSIGEALGTSEDAAQKRVSRALDKMGLLLGRKGLALSATTLAAMLAVEEIAAAPAGLAATITAAVLSGTTITTTTTVIAATKKTAMTSLQRTVVTTLCAVAVGTGVYEARQAGKARSEAQEGQERQAIGADQLTQPISERDDTALQLVALQGENQGLNREVRRLRGEIARSGQRVADSNQAPQVLPIGGSLMRLPLISKNSFVKVRQVVPWDDVIVTAGWKTQSPSTNRLFIFVTPKRASDPNHLTIETHVLECPENVAEQLGLEGIRTPMSTESQSSMILTHKQYEAVIWSASQTTGVRFLESQAITTANGQQTLLETPDIKRTLSGDEFDSGPVVNILPTISTDGQSVEMAILAHPNDLVPSVGVKE